MARPRVSNVRVTILLRGAGGESVSRDAASPTDDPEASGASATGGGKGSRKAAKAAKRDAAKAAKRAKAEHKAAKKAASKASKAIAAQAAAAEKAAKRRVKAAKQPFVNMSREFLARSEHRVVLVQIVHQGENPGLPAGSYPVTVRGRNCVDAQANVRYVVP